MSKVAGITNIETDTNALLCTFEVTDPNVDYEAELERLAETNTHIAGYSIN